MEQFTLTKEEFITRSMKGEVFVSTHSDKRFYYDNKYTIPFRVNDEDLDNNWSYMDGRHPFILEQPKPKIERRWKYRKDTLKYTQETNYYYTDEEAKSSQDISDWYKAEDCFIDVEIKG